MQPQTCANCYQTTRDYVDYRPAWGEGKRVFHYCTERGCAKSMGHIVLVGGAL